MKDFYAILGVSRDATREEIRRRFLELTREKHPDRFQGEAKREAEEEFQEITQAFNNLVSPELRRQHDAALREPRESAADPAKVAKVYLQRGVKAYKAKKFREAAENFRRATEADPENAMAWHHLARTCSKDERYLAQAREAIGKACKLQPMKVSYLRLAGSIFRQAGEREKAIHYLRKAVQWSGEDPEIKAELDDLTGKGKKKSFLGGIFDRMGDR